MGTNMNDIDKDTNSDVCSCQTEIRLSDEMHIWCSSAI